jgi:hypothetical protein
MSMTPSAHTTGIKKDVGIQACDPIAPVYPPQPHYRQRGIPGYDGDNESDDDMSLWYEDEPVKTGAPEDTLAHLIHGRQSNHDLRFSDDERCRRKTRASRASKVSVLS